MKQDNKGHNKAKTQNKHDLQPREAVNCFTSGKVSPHLVASL